MGEHRKNVGKRINSALAQRNRTQKELAEHLGVKPNVISYFCNGDRTPNTEQIVKISTFLNVSTDYLLCITDVMNPDQNIKNVSSFTGLSEKAVNGLLYLKNKEYFEIVDFALSFDEALEERGEPNTFSTLTTILKKALEISQADMKMDAFADAVCDIANVQFGYRDIDSEDDKFFRDQLDKMQSDLSCILPERLVYDERFEDFELYCLQYTFSDFIASLAYKYSADDDNRNILKSKYMQILQDNIDKLKKYVEKLQEREVISYGEHNDTDE